MVEFHNTKIAVKRSFIVFAVFGLLSACVTVDKTSDVKYEPTNAESVDLIHVIPYRTYEKVGTVSASGYNSTDIQEMYASLRDSAADEGADAIIINNVGYENSMWGDNKLSAEGELIKYNSASPPAGAPIIVTAP